MAVSNNIQVSSPAFEQGGEIPSKFTCDGENISPEINISNWPKATKSLALIMDDPDAPVGTWTHWIAWNIPLVDAVAENTAPGIEGENDFHKPGYGGPCPPQGNKAHRYFLRIYALDTELDVPALERREKLEQAMEGHILASGELMGIYKREYDQE